MDSANLPGHTGRNTARCERPRGTGTKWLPRLNAMRIYFLSRFPSAPRLWLVNRFRIRRARGCKRAETRERSSPLIRATGSDWLVGETSSSSVIAGNSTPLERFDPPLCFRSTLLPAALRALFESRPCSNGLEFSSLPHKEIRFVFVDAAPTSSFASACQNDSS